MTLASLNDGLVAYYPFDGNAQDASGNNYHGTVYGAILTTDRTGNPNKAYHFNGTDSEIIVNQKYFAKANQLTVSLWVKPDPNNQALYFAMCSDFGVWSNVGEVGLAISIPNTNSAGGTVGDGWNHLVGTYDGITIKAYVNGTFANQTSHAGNISDPNRVLTFGRFNNTSEYWIGDLDEVRIYNRVLSDSEIKQLYQGQVPEIDIQGNNISIPNGDTTPDTNDGTDFGSVTPINNNQITHIFIIQNTGTGTLNLLAGDLQGVGCSPFSMTSLTSSTLLPTGTSSFQIAFKPTAVGEFICTVNIPNNDSDENPYRFNVKGTAIPFPPEIDIQGNKISIPNGDTTPSTNDDTDFGSITPNTQLTHTFIIQNTGTGTLNLLAGNGNVQGVGCSPFSMTSLTSSTLLPTGTSSFQVVFTPTTVGEFICTVNIPNNDSDENPYRFNVKGTAIPFLPEIDVQGNGISIPNGDTTPSSSDKTDFNSVKIGNTLTNMFSIRNIGKETLTITNINLLGTGCDPFSVTQPTSSHLGPSASATFQITFAPTIVVVGSWSCTLNIANDDSDENPYTFTLTGRGQQPLAFSTMTINLSGNGSGSIKANQQGALCNNQGSKCNYIYPTGSAVVLTATPEINSTFAGWTSVDCAGSFVITHDMNCTAIFKRKGDVLPPITSVILPSTLTLGITLEGTGEGTITSQDKKIHCTKTGQQCQTTYPTGTMVTLTPLAEPGSYFSSWGGNEDCTDSRVQLWGSESCVAYFHKFSELTVKKVGEGNVIGKGINCGKDCSESYPLDASITLTAVPAQNSTFKKWKGECTGTSPKVRVTMNKAKTCTALFLNLVQSDFFYGSEKTISVSVSPSQIGVVLKKNNVPIESLAKNFNMTIIRKVKENMLIFKLAQVEGISEAEKRFFLAQRARELKQQNKEWIAQAGLVAVPSLPNHSQTEIMPMIMSDLFVAHFKPDVDKNQIKMFNQRFAVEVAMENPFIKNQFLLKITEETPATSLEIANFYKESGLTEYAHPDFIQVLEFRSEPNDSLFRQQWHHHNSGQEGGTQDADIDAPEAWDLTKGDPNVVIAVIDYSFDLDHPDLKPNYVNYFDFTRCINKISEEVCNSDLEDCINDLEITCNGEPVELEDSNTAEMIHGTAVVGAAAAKGNNGLGVTGSCQDCKIMPLRIGQGLDDFIKGLAFGHAKNKGARIISNSWDFTSFVPPSIKMAIEKVTKDESGSIVLFAMSNAYENDCTSPNIVTDCTNNGLQGEDCTSIFGMENVIAVSSSTNKDQFDQVGHGNCMDVLAPSMVFPKSINRATLAATTTDRRGNKGYNTNQGICDRTNSSEESDLDYTNCFGGTSFSTPLVAGIAGLVLSVKPDLNRLQVQRLLQDTADKIEPSQGQYDPNTGFSKPVGGVATHGWGRVNAFEAVRTARNGVDIFLRDNPLDWGNTEQPSSTLFEPTRGSIPWWTSMDIKVDAPPHRSLPPNTSGEFDDFVDEKPSLASGEVNKVYVRVHNRGPMSAEFVTVKLYWTQFGTALPNLPADFWTNFPNNSVNTSKWHPLNCMNPNSPSCSIIALKYSGSSVTGTSDDQAQIVTFEFPAPSFDVSLANHFCLVAMIDSLQDKLSSLVSQARFVVDELTPRDNNVTHRNYLDLDTRNATQVEANFFARNPFDYPIQSFLTLKAPQNWKVMLDQSFGFNQLFPLKPYEEVLIKMTASIPEPGLAGRITLIQNRKVFLRQRSGRTLESDSHPDEMMGGITLQLQPFIEGNLVGQQPELKISSNDSEEALPSHLEALEPSTTVSEKGKIKDKHVEPTTPEAISQGENSVATVQKDTKNDIDGFKDDSHISQLEAQIAQTEGIMGDTTITFLDRDSEILPSVEILPIPICPTEGLIDWICNAQGQTLHDLTIGTRGSLSNGILVGTLDNQGWVSNLTINAQGIVKGGIVTGYILNQGTLVDITFVGAMLQGGTLAGTILNASQVGGTLIDVTFAPNARLKGGKLQGQIRGDREVPVLLEEVRILKGSTLLGVKLGQDVFLEEWVQIE